MPMPAHIFQDYLKLDSCGGYPANYSAGEEQYREYAAM